MLFDGTIRRGPRPALLKRAEMGLTSQLLLPGPLLPGCRALPVSRAGGAGRTQTPCGLAPIPSSGDPTCSIGYPGQTGHMGCHLRGGKISARGPGGTGPPPDIRGHELSAATSIQVDLAGEQARFCARTPTSRGPCSCAVGINVNP